MFKLMKINFLASENNFLPFSQTAASECSFFFKWNIFFSHSFSQILKTNYIPVSGQQFFQLFSNIFKMEAVLLYSKSVFFNILYPASPNKFSAHRNSIFLVGAILLLLGIISVIRRQWQFFSSSGNVYFNEIFILAGGN